MKLDLTKENLRKVIVAIDLYIVSAEQPFDNELDEIRTSLSRQFEEKFGESVYPH